jgi:hypothetical protein
MPYQINDVAQVNHQEFTTNYFFAPKHRGHPTDEISVWIIDYDSELLCFKSTFQNSWFNATCGWGILAALNGLMTLGRNLKNDQLIIAKFVVDQNQWHGYPADIRNKPKDKPLPNILLAWHSSGIISKSLLSRIKQGQI